MSSSDRKAAAPRQKSLKLNFIMNVLLSMSTFIFPLISYPYASRILLPEGLGKVSFATSVVSYFSIFAQLGIPTYGIKICAGVRDDKEKLSQTVQELLIINTVTVVISYVVFFIMLGTVPRMEADRPLFLVLGLTILLNMLGMEWLYKALEQYTYITVRSVFFKFLAVVALLLLVHNREDYVIYGGITILAASCSNILNFLHIHRFISLRPTGHYNFRRHWKPIAILFAVACATTIYTHLDKVMLGFMTTDTETGYYDAAIKVKTILVSVVTSLGAVLMPRSSYYVKQHQMDKFNEIAAKAVNFVMLLAIPLVVYFFFFSRECIYLLSGRAFEGAIRPMQAIMPTVLFIGLTDVMGNQMMIPLGKEKYVLYSRIGGAVTDLILNALLIPRIASTGAALGTLAAEAAVFVVQFVAMRHEVTAAYRKVHYGPILLGVVLGSVLCLWTKRLPANVFIILVISALIFFGTYVLVLTLAREPLMLEIEQTMIGKLKRKRA